MPGAKFYPNSTLNFAENCLAHDADDSHIAVISHTKAGIRTVVGVAETMCGRSEIRYITRDW